MGFFAKPAQNIKRSILRIEISCLGDFLNPSWPSLVVPLGKGDGRWFGMGGTNRSDARLNLSGSWQQGHSATYNTPSRI